MRVLGVDTTTPFGSIALLDGETLGAVCGVGPASHHAEDLLPAIDSLMSRMGWSLKELTGLAVASGPGSFTGLKIGIASMEGLSMARDLPLVGISSLLATAWPLRFVDGLVAAILPAYRGEVYGATFEANSRRGALSPGIEPVCEPPEALAARLPDAPVWLVGSGVARYREAFQSSLGDNALFPEVSHFLAEAVVRLGAKALERGDSGVDVLYVRASEAERNRERS